MVWTSRSTSADPGKTSEEKERREVRPEARREEPASSIMQERRRTFWLRLWPFEGKNLSGVVLWWRKGTALTLDQNAVDVQRLYKTDNPIMLVLGVLVFCGIMSVVAMLMANRRPPLPTPDSTSSDEDFNAVPEGNEESHKVRMWGVLWKLEYQRVKDLLKVKNMLRLNNDLADQDGINETFLMLENWDLRFFTLHVEKKGVVLSYYSDLDKMKLSSFIVHSIDAFVFSVQLSNRTNLPQIPRYEEYLESIRNFVGYNVQADARDPVELHVITLRVVREPKSGDNVMERKICEGAIVAKPSNSPPHSSIHVNFSWEALSRTSSEVDDGQLEWRCLASASASDSQKWHDEISRRLQSYRRGKFSRRNST
jgi:hypothetical protein